MPEYKLSILVEGADRGASDVLLHLHSGLGALNVALGTLVADGLRAATGALIDFGKQGLSVAVDYQSSMNMFQAVSGATSDQMAAIGVEAKRLGADMTLPATSAGDAAKAMTELAKAGLSVNNALLAGKGTLQLAAAGNIDEAKAAEIAANALNSFGLAGDKATMVADLFAAAANKSSLEVTDVADGFKMASAVFSAFQGPVVGSEKALKDLTTAMALLGNVGIKGSDAGTSLKQMLLQLTGPSAVAKDKMKALMYAAMGAAGGMDQLDTVLSGNAKERGDALGALGKANPSIAKMGDIAFDGAGKMRPLQDIIKLVSQATKGMTDEMRDNALTSIFGADATRAIIGLMRAGPDAFGAMETSISQQGAAADLAGARMKGLGGAWEGFKSILETTQLSVMEPLLGPLEAGVRMLADALAGATPFLVDFVQGSVIPAVQWFGQLLADFVAAPDKLSFLTGLLSGAAGAMSGWAKSIFDFVITSLPGWMDNLARWGAALVEWVAPMIPPLLGALGTLLGTIGQWFINRGPELLGKLAEWGQKLVDWVAPYIPPLLVEAGKLLEGFWTWIKGQAPLWGAQLLAWGNELVAWVGPQIPPLLVEAGKLALSLWGWIQQQVPVAAAALSAWALEFVHWIGPALGLLIVEAGTAFGKFLTWITSDKNGQDIQGSLTSWTGAFLVWTNVTLPTALLQALGGMGATVWAGIVEKWNAAFSPGSLGKSLIDGLITGLAANWGHLGDWLSSQWAALTASLGIPGQGGSSSGGSIYGGSTSGGGFATGVRNFGGGLALVGERGPELVNLPGGSDVIPSGATRGLLSGGGGAISVGQIVINGSSDPAATARAVREELIRMGRSNLNIFGGYA